jgi:Calcineurin-like phosphoesterase
MLSFPNDLFPFRVQESMKLLFRIRASARRIFLSFIFLQLSVLSAGLPFSKPSSTPKNPAEEFRATTIVAIGDVHGDFEGFCAILKRVGLIDAQHQWTGSKSTLVQTGDLIDRGAKGREAMDFLISLEKMASNAGGQVIPLLGNHEIMNLAGDLRYVSAEDYAHYAETDSEKRRKSAYHDYAAWRASHADMLAALQPPVFPATEEEWIAKHPPGFLEHSEVFGPAGIYGKWIRSHAAISKIGDIVFVHGGIDSALTSMKLDHINAQIHDEIEEFDSIKQYLVSRKIVLPFFTLQEIVAAVQAQLHAERASEKARDADSQAKLVRILGFVNSLSMREDGPLWFRGYDQWIEEEGSSQIEKIMGAYNVKHIVVGHTVQQTARIRSRFAGRVFLIDTGMLSTYWRGGRASALEIRDARKFVALYLDSEEVLFEEKPSSPTPAEK